MAKQRYINTRFWRDSYIENLDPTEKLLFLYLLSNPDTNISGIYEIPIKIIAVDTGIDVSMVKKLFDRFEKDDKIKYKDGWVAFKNFTLHQAISPKIKAGIINEISKAPEEMVKWVNLEVSIPYPYPIQEVSDLNTNTNINTNTNSEELEKEKKKPKKAPAKAGNFYWNFIGGLYKKNKSLDIIYKSALMYNCEAYGIDRYDIATNEYNKIVKILSNYKSDSSYRPINCLLATYVMYWYKQNHGGIPFKYWEQIGWIGEYNNIHRKYFGNFQEYYLYNIFTGDTKKVDPLSYDEWCKQSLKFSFEDKE